MLMNDKIIFDRYYCINSTETKEIMCKIERNMVHYILQPHHQGRRRLLKSGTSMKYQRRFTSAEGTSWGRAREGAFSLS